MGCITFPDCGINMLYVTTSDSLLDDIANKWKKSRGSNKWKKVVYLVIQAAVWCIWRERNKLIFDNKRQSVGKVVKEIKAMVFLWIWNRAKLFGLTWDKWRESDLLCMGV